MSVMATTYRLQDAGELPEGWVPESITCPVCGAVLWPGVDRRADARYCSQACRSKAYRRRHHDEQP